MTLSYPVLAKTANGKTFHRIGAVCSASSDISKDQVLARAKVGAKLCEKCWTPNQFLDALINPPRIYLDDAIPKSGIHAWQRKDRSRYQCKKCEAIIQNSGLELPSEGCRVRRYRWRNNK